MRPNTELRMQILMMLEEKDGEVMTAQEIATAVNCGISSAKHTAESLVTSGAIKQRNTPDGRSGYHVPNEQQIAEEMDRHALRCQFKPLTPRKQYNEAVARALAERTAIPSIG